MPQPWDFGLGRHSEGEEYIHCIYAFTCFEDFILMLLPKMEQKEISAIPSFQTPMNWSPVKVLCSNPTCPTSLLMHTNCFAKFEDITCTKLTKHARCRGWSDRQVRWTENVLKFALEYFFQVRTSVWNQRGYDLAFKFCSCDCGHGHLRKQLQEAMENKEEKKRKKEKTNQLPKLNVGDKGKVSDVKDFSDKFCKKIADGVQAVPTKQQTVSPWMKLKENPHEEEAPLTEGLAAHTLASSACINGILF